MKISAEDRRTLAAEIATLIVDSWAIGKWESQDDPDHSTWLRPAAESEVRETVAEAITRCCEFGGIVLREK